MDRKLKHLFRLERLIEDRYEVLHPEKKEELTVQFSRYQEIAAELRCQFDELYDLTLKEKGTYPCRECFTQGTACCRNCHAGLGYYSAVDILRARHIGMDWKRILMEGWSNTGFLTEAGCSLPQELMSYNCLRQICSLYRGEVEGMDGQVTREMRDNIRALGEIYSRVEDIIGYHDFPAF